jgi:diphosphomevalonate decarboxylase
VSSTAVAYPNIALIKYWGKQDERLILPATASLSLTLDVFATTTTVQPSDDRTDSVVLNGSEIQGAFADRVIGFLDLIRTRAGSSRRARVITRNDGPTAAGLASSSSGFAALTLAASTAFGMDLPPKELSRLARRGSGSACRSIYPGLSSWRPGSDATSYAEAVPSNGLDLAMVIVMVSAASKSISSRAAMRVTTCTSPYYQAWVEASQIDMSLALDAVGAADLPALGRVVERNALRMHATMLAADPPIIYFEPLTLELVRFAGSLRSEGCQVFATMDAGPNVKLLCSGGDADAVAQAVSGTFDVEAIIARSGPGAHRVDGEVRS